MPRRSLIDVVVLHVPENKAGPGFSWQARSMNTLVTHVLVGFDDGADIQFQDFLSVRKIPVKSRGRLGEDGVAASSNDEPEPQTVSSYLATIREHLLRDRALHDMVRPTLFF
jgi:hypothetical protein